jgi:hypothetical protein
MGTLVDDLLLLARVSRAEISLGPVDLSAEVAAIAGRVQAREPGRRVRFAIHDGGRVTAGHTLIRTMLQNVIDNAWTFTAKRDGATSEFATTVAEDAEVCCYVRDNGPASILPMWASCSSRSSGFIRLPSFLLPESAWPAFGGSSNATAGVPGPEGAVGRGATFLLTLNAKEAPRYPVITLSLCYTTNRETANPARRWHVRRAPGGDA